MSVSYEAKLIVGVPMSELVKEDTVTEEVGKFDPDTGKAVKKTVTRTRWLVCGKEYRSSHIEDCGSPFSNPDEFAREAFGLEAADSGYSEKSSREGHHIVFGVIVADGIIDEGLFKQITGDKIDAATNRVIEWLSSKGYADRPGIYLVGECG